MTRHTFVRRLGSICAGAIVFAGFLFTTCTKNNPLSDNSWTVTLNVQDGLSGKNLEATVHYTTNAGAEASATTDSTGRLAITGLTPGFQSFTIYKAADSTQYTSAVVTTAANVGTISDQTAGNLRDTSMIVLLYPLTGKITGTVGTGSAANSQILRPIAGAVVEVSYSQPQGLNFSPHTFTTISNAQGNFILTGLPVTPPGAATTPTLSCPNITLNNTTYSATVPTVPALVSGTTVGVGNVVYTQNAMAVLVTSSNVLTTNGQGLTLLSPTIVPYFVIPTLNNLSILQVTYSGASSINATITEDGDTVFARPVVQFAPGGSYKVTINGIDSLGNAFSVTGPSFTIQPSLYVTATNTWDAFGNAAINFVMYDTLWVAFSAPLDTNPLDITWAAEGSQNDLYGQGNSSANAVAWVHGDTLFVKPNVQTALIYSQTTGFKATVKSSLGTPVTVAEQVTVMPDPLNVQPLNNNIVSQIDSVQSYFRPFKVIGDSLVVKFSQKVDTSAAAKTKFSVSFGGKRTIVTWDPTVTVATIKNIDTLPAADFNPSNGYTTGATSTTAISSVTFNLTTVNGEQKSGLAGIPAIQIHTEPGLCVTNTNLLLKHDTTTAVAASETPTTVFPNNGPITVTFDRALDTARIRANLLNTFMYLRLSGNTSNIPVAFSFSPDGRTITVKPSDTLIEGSQYNIYLVGVPGMGIDYAGAVHNQSGTFTGAGANNALFSTSFTVLHRYPNISAIKATIQPDTNSVLYVQGKRMGASPANGSGNNVFEAVVGTANTNDVGGLHLQLTEAAWNSNHANYVAGYRVQIERVTRTGDSSGWYTCANTIPTTAWSPFNATDSVYRVSFNLSAENFASLVETQNDGNGYSNPSPELFNDSARILLRVQPYISNADSSKGQVGQWSAPVVYVDNIAPCDSDFVTAANCNNSARGGISAAATGSFNNAGASGPSTTTYIEVTFPEDMNVLDSTKVPVINFYYGPYAGAGTYPSVQITKAMGPGTGYWRTSTVYRQYFSVPAFDYTNAASGNGAFWNVDVSTCQNASGVQVQSYGSSGNAIGNIDYTTTHQARAAVAGQLQGSKLIIQAFMLCN